MIDLIKIARQRIDDSQRTHWEGCERDHRECLIQRMADEIERLRQWETCGREWLNKTDWVQQRMNSGDLPATALGKHRADVMREEIERLTAAHDHQYQMAGLMLREAEKANAENERLTAERDKAQRKYERQREATVNTYARVRRLIEALRVTGQHSNKWKLKYKSQVPSLKRTIRDLCAERDELRRQLDPMGEYASADELIAALHAEKAQDEAIKKDARRYRDWLRGGANIPPESTRWPRWEVRYWNGRHWITLFDEQMDAAIDAAMGGNNE